MKLNSRRVIALGRLSLSAWITAATLITATTSAFAAKPAYHRGATGRVVLAGVTTSSAMTGAGQQRAHMMDVPLQGALADYQKSSPATWGQNLATDMEKLEPRQLPVYRARCVAGTYRARSPFIGDPLPWERVREGWWF